MRFNGMTALDRFQFAIGDRRGAAVSRRRPVFEPVFGRFAKGVDRRVQVRRGFGHIGAEEADLRRRGRVLKVCGVECVTPSRYCLFAVMRTSYLLFGMSAR